MKILSMAWTIYDERIEYFCKDCTGGGLIIKNICQYIGKSNDSYLFLGKYKLPEMKLGNFQVVDTLSEDKAEDPKIDENEKHLRSMTRAFERAIERIHPDIVNFHGIGMLAQRCIDICRERDIPCVYTEHLYIGMQRTFDKYERVVEWEKELYKVPNLHIIAVSTGMKKKILNDFPEIEEKNVTVIKNGTDFEAKLVKSNLISKYKLENKKTLLCVGTILARKNQKQLVRAFSLLEKELQNDIRVIFCGNDGMRGELQEEIEKNFLGDKLIYAGPQSSEDMKKFYSIADGLIMPSLAEGLSIAALEAIAYGLPIIMFSDSECADDLYDKSVVCFAYERTDESLKEAIVEWHMKKWDKKYIKSYSKNFSMDRVAEDYIKYYEYILQGEKGDEIG